MLLFPDTLTVSLELISARVSPKPLDWTWTLTKNCYTGKSSEQLWFLIITRAAFESDYEEHHFFGSRASLPSPISVTVADGWFLISWRLRVECPWGFLQTNSTLLGAVFHFHGFQYICKLTAPKFVSQQVLHPEIMPFGHIDYFEINVLEKQLVQEGHWTTFFCWGTDRS